MLQTQSYSNVLNMAVMLPLADQQRLIKDIMANVSRVNVYRNTHPYTWDELRAEVREAESQIASGKTYSSEEDDRLFDEFLRNDLELVV